MRGASVHFEPIQSAMHAVAHASRRVPPQYLLPAEHSLGTHVVIDDKGEVQKRLKEKMALASRQAKAKAGFSPLWEGVINLPHPSKAVTAEHQVEIVKEWCKRYEAITGHKVLRADVHLDEGFVDEHGKAHYNGHAHVMCDRTDASGRVLRVLRSDMREIQQMTAEVTQLERGKDARQTGRQHLNHVQYRFAAEQSRQQLEQSKARYDQILDIQVDLLKDHRSKAKTLAEELAEAKALAEQYKAERDALKASGVAKQADYQALKQQYEAALAEVAQVKQEATQAKEEATAVQKRLKKVAEIANKNFEIATAAQAEAKDAKAETERLKEQLEVAQAEAKEAKEGQRLFNDELERTYDRMIKAEQKLYKLEKAQTQPPPQPTPEKSLGERISASFEAMLEWIRQQGGKFRELNKQSGLGIGPIEHIDAHHCVQSQGQGVYCIHRLDELDRVPRTDVQIEEIHYRNGRGHVKPQHDRGMDFGR